MAARTQKLFLFSLFSLAVCAGAPVTRHEPLKFAGPFARINCGAFVQIIARFYTPGGYKLAGGTGTVIHRSGLVITAAHVVKDVTEAEYIEAVFWNVSCTDRKAYLVDARRVELSILRLSDEKDAALLQPIERENFPAFHPPRRGYKLEPKEAVWFFGECSLQSVGQVEKTDLRANKVDPVIQVDADVEFGDSGAPLLTMGGKYVGILITKLPNNQRGGNFVPMDDVAKALNLEEILKKVNREERP